MRFADYLALAVRSLRRSRLRSGLTISAVVVGATGLTIMLTFVTTIKSYVVNQFVQTGQIRQIQVAETPNLSYSPGGQIEGGPQNGGGPTLTAALEAKIGALAHVTAVAATVQFHDQTLQYFAFGSHKLSINGVSAYQANGVIEPTLIAGRDFGAHDIANTVLITQDYANVLGFKGKYDKLIGQQVDLHTSQGYTGVGAQLPNVLPTQNQCGPGNSNNNQPCGQTSGLPAANLRATVVGVVNTSYQQQTIYLPFSWAIGIGNQAQPVNVQYPQQFNGGPGSGSPQGPGTVQGGWSTQTAAQFIASQGGYQSFLVSVDKIDNIGPVARAIARFNVNAATGLDALNSQKQAANIVGLIAGALGLIALGIAALGVMNTMVMSVLERTREIGVMRALGARRSTIRRLFSIEAAGLGFFGGVFGVAIGYVFVLIAKSVIVRLIKSGKTLSGVNFTVPIWLVVTVIAGTTLIGFVSGLFPARRAARLDPVEALRYE